MFNTLRAHPALCGAFALLLCVALIGVPFLSARADPVTIIVLAVTAVASGVAGYDYATCDSLHVVSAWGCPNGGGGGGSSVSQPPSPPPPTCPASGAGCTFAPGCESAAPACSPVGANSVATLPGGKVNLAWSCPSGTYQSSQGDANFSTNGSLGGSATVAPSQTTTYTLKCVAQGGNSTGTATVNVSQAGLSIIPSASRAQKGSSVTITWNATNVLPDSCEVSSNASSAVWQGNSGSEQATVGAQTIFTLSCSVPSGSVSESTTVNLVPSYQEI